MTETPNKPVLVGMNNPYNSDPHFALYPSPKGCAGYNVYAMLAEARERRVSAYGPDSVRELTRASYVKGFDRRNVLSARTWTKREAREQGRILAKELCGRRVVVFGVQTLEALGLNCGWQGVWSNQRVWLELRTAQSALDASERRPHIEYWLAPHPSGRCREYNDPSMRERVGDLLLRLYDEARPCA